MPRAIRKRKRYDSAAVSLANPIRNISDTALWVTGYEQKD